MKLFSILTFALLSFGLAAESNQSTSHLEKIVLGSGCFWGAEKGYEELPGVVDAVSGYADGYGVRPSYREITKFITEIILPAVRQAHLACLILFVLKPHVSNRTFSELERDPKEDSLIRYLFSIG